MFEFRRSKTERIKRLFNLCSWPNVIYTTDISVITKINYYYIYSILAQLENENYITSDWVGTYSSGKKRRGYWKIGEDK